LFGIARARSAVVGEPMAFRFDRGTLLVDGAAAERLAAVVWDGRVQAWHAPAFRYAELVAQARALGLELCDEVGPHLSASSASWVHPELRPYQRDALAAWHAFHRRGLVVLPTGSGKTIVAAAALAKTGRRSLILCPTRALLEQWERQLQRHYRGAIGVVGDGARRIEDVTIMTFESAYRQVDGPFSAPGLADARGRRRRHCAVTRSLGRALRQAAGPLVPRGLSCVVHARDEGSLSRRQHESHRLCSRESGNVPGSSVRQECLRRVRRQVERPTKPRQGAFETGFQARPEPGAVHSCNLSDIDDRSAQQTDLALA
jgi:Xeroderma pigmentosum group B helicase damage recognition domain/Type III restriction enzyme, res subunit